MTDQPPDMTAKTGEDCPESGIWEVIGNPSATATLVKGNIMPPHEGKSVVWRLFVRW